jgi:hypothetical protein
MIRILILLAFAFKVTAQSLTPEFVCDLPEILKENSGLIVVNDSTILFHNDSGNDACLQLVNERCEILSKHCLANAKNVDWEAITRDTRGNIFIGDIGNNRNNRRQTVIYRVSLENLLRDSLSYADEIRLNYLEDFPPPVHRQMFDAEALVWHDDSLFIFSKNRREPYDGVSWVFGFPDIPGEYAISPIDSIKISGMGRMLSWVTDAAYDAGSRVLLLLGSNQITAIHHDADQVFWRGKQHRLSLPMISQKEAIGFGSAVIYLSDEQFSGLPGGKLYRLPKKLLFKTLEIDPLLQPIDFGICISEKIVDDHFDISFNLPYNTWMAYELLTYQGEQRLINKPRDLNAGFHRIEIPVGNIFPDIYILNIIIDGIPSAFIVRKTGDAKKAIEEFRQEQEKVIFPK